MFLIDLTILSAGLALLTGAVWPRRIRTGRAYLARTRWPDTYHVRFTLEPYQPAPNAALFDARLLNASTEKLHLIARTIRAAQPFEARAIDEYADTREFWRWLDEQLPMWKGVRP